MVVHEHPRLLRKLRRLPGANTKDMNVDRERIMTIYLTVMKHGDTTLNADEETRAVIACRADIEKEWPKIAKVGRALEQVRRAQR
jgi:hypothetical protein